MKEVRDQSVSDLIFILAGRDLGATTSEISDALGLSPSNVSRRHEAACNDPKMKELVREIFDLYGVNEESQ